LFGAELDVWTRKICIKKKARGWELIHKKYKANKT
jgi:hypothetical protein